MVSEPDLEPLLAISGSGSTAPEPKLQYLFNYYIFYYNVVSEEDARINKIKTISTTTEKYY